jgi:hypothetical protein
MRRAARRDDNEKAIVDALRAAGAFVWFLDAKGVPDILCGFRGRFLLLEVKAPAGPKGGTSHRELRPSQEKFFEVCRSKRLPVFVVRSAEEALEAVVGGPPRCSWLQPGACMQCDKVPEGECRQSKGANR